MKYFRPGAVIDAQGCACCVAVPTHSKTPTSVPLTELTQAAPKSLAIPWEAASGQEARFDHHRLAISAAQGHASLHGQSRMALHSLHPCQLMMPLLALLYYGALLDCSSLRLVQRILAGRQVLVNALTSQESPHYDWAPTQIAV